MGFVRDESKEASQQQQLIPDVYFLQQNEPDSNFASSHHDEEGAMNNDSSPCLPQGKMGSITDAQFTPYPHVNVGSNNESKLDQHLDVEVLDSHNQNLLSTRNLQSSEANVTRT